MALFRHETVIFRILFSLMVAQLVGGCDPVVRDPWIEIVVHQTDRDVTFEFFIHKRTWWSSRIERVPHEVTSLIVGDLTSLRWEVRSRDVGIGVKKIRYGVVPEGFDQLVPKKGTAPPLNGGAEYEVVAHSAGGGTVRFVYQIR